MLESVEGIYLTNPQRLASPNHSRLNRGNESTGQPPHGANEHGQLEALKMPGFSKVR